MPTPSQEPPASSKAPNEDLKDFDVFCTFKIKIERKKIALVYPEPYPNRDEDTEPKTGNVSILQSPESGLKGHGCSLHLQNQVREPKFGTCVYQRPISISKLRSRPQRPNKNLQHPPKPEFRT